MTQPSLFDEDATEGGGGEPQAPDPQTLARATDPATSHAAAERIAPSAGELRRWAADCVRLKPGRTARELAAEFCPLDPRRIGRRLGEAANLGLIRRGDDRHCSISGSLATTWHPPADGESPADNRTTAGGLPRVPTLAELPEDGTGVEVPDNH